MNDKSKQMSIYLRLPLDVFAKLKALSDVNKTSMNLQVRNMILENFGHKKENIKRGRPKNDA